MKLTNILIAFISLTTSFSYVFGGQAESQEAPQQQIQNGQERKVHFPKEVVKASRKRKVKALTPSNAHFDPNQHMNKAEKFEAVSNAKKEYRERFGKEAKTAWDLKKLDTSTEPNDPTRVNTENNKKLVHH